MIRRLVCTAVLVLASLARAQTGNLGLDEVDVKRPNTAVTAADRALVCALSPNGNSVGVTGAVTQGSPPWTMRLQDGAGATLATVTGANALKVDGSAVVQPISGSVGLNTGANTIGKVDQGLGGSSAWKVDGSAVVQPVSGTVTANPTFPATPTPTTVTVTGSSTTVLASNPSRRVATIWNDDANNSAFITFGPTASSTTFTVKMSPTDYYELPQPAYTGIITGISSASSTVLRVTEVTP